MKKILLLGLILGIAMPVTTVSYADDSIDLKRIWKKNCRKCHGNDGSGNTPAGKKLKVLDYTKKEVQEQLSDDVILKVIKEGATDANGEELMKPYGDVLSEAEIAALAAYVRTLVIE